MMKILPKKATSDIVRLRQIFTVMSNYGLGQILKELDVKIPFFFRFRPSRIIKRFKRPVEMRLRLAFEELGPTFIKLGQVMANRPDIFPESYVAELSKLHDSAEPLSYQEFTERLAICLEQPVEEVFSDIDTEALATASMAQVHLATLISGEKVVVKLRRPNIKENTLADLRLIKRLAKIIVWRYPEYAQFQPDLMVDQFTLSMMDELDFNQEAVNAQAFTEMFIDNNQVIIPRFYTQFCSEKINVQQNIPGVPATKKELIAQTDWDLDLHAKNVMVSFLKMVLHKGVFHSDLHPGNILLLSGGRIAFVDFGSVGRLTHKRRRQLLTFLESIVYQKATLMADVLYAWTHGGDFDYGYLTDISEEFISKHKQLKVSESTISGIIIDFMTTLRQSKAYLPSDLILFFKTLLCLDVLLARSLNASFDLLEYIEPFVSEEATRRVAENSVLNQTMKTLEAMGEIRDEVLWFSKYAGRKMREGGPLAQIDMPQIDSFVSMFDKVSSRISLAVITASMIMGSAIISDVAKGPEILGLPAFGFISFVGAGLGGLYVLYSIARGTKRKKNHDYLAGK